MALVPAGAALGGSEYPVFEARAPLPALADCSSQLYHMDLLSGRECGFLRSEARPEVESFAGISRLASTIANFPGQPFAVVDGGLFLDQADTEVQAAGPWLVGLDQAANATERVLAMPQTKPAITFWSCGGGETVLFKHLRTLNMARIPEWAADGGSKPPKANKSPCYETVFFRHWDPRVLGALLPVLDAPQFKRILGPAEEIAFDAAGGTGFRRVVADPSWPPASGGLLLIHGDQFTALIDRRVSMSHRRIGAYLRRYAPERVSHLDDRSLHDLVASMRRRSGSTAFGGKCRLDCGPTCRS